MKNLIGRRVNSKVVRCTEYVLVTLWDSMDAVRRFAGPEPERAVYYPEDDIYFPEDERTPYVRYRRL